MLQNCINGFSEQINTCLQIYMQMVQQLQQGVNASKVFSNADNGGISTINLKNNKLILDATYAIATNNYLNYYNETAI